MQAYRVIVGIGQDRHGAKFSPERVSDSLEQAGNDAIETFGGYFVTSGGGGYKHHDGRIVEEPSRAYTILANSVTDVQNWAHNLAQNLGQESVIVIHPDGSAEFIEPVWFD